MTEKHEWEFAPWDRELAPRLAVGWFAGAKILSDGRPHSIRILQAEMARSSDLALSTCWNMIRGAAKAGLLYNNSRSDNYKVTDLGMSTRPELRYNGEQQLYGPWSIGGGETAAWNVAAGILSDGQWHRIDRLRQEMVKVTEGLTEKFCTQMVREVSAYKYLDRRVGRHGTRYYRANDLGRERRPELRGTVEPLVRDETTTVVK